MKQREPGLTTRTSDPQLEGRKDSKVGDVKERSLEWESAGAEHLQEQGNCN